MSDPIHLKPGDRVGPWTVASIAHDLGPTVNELKVTYMQGEPPDAEAKRDQWKADVRDAAIARADKAEAERDRIASRCSDFGFRLVRVEGDRDELRARLDALRAELVRTEAWWRGLGRGDAAIILDGAADGLSRILAADYERGQP